MFQCRRSDSAKPAELWGYALVFPEADGTDSFAGWIQKWHIPDIEARLKLERTLDRQIRGYITRITNEYDYEEGGGHTIEGVLTIIIN